RPPPSASSFPYTTLFRSSERMVPGHILTGPVAIKGAEVGDVLEVDVLDVKLRQDWGYNLIRPLAGTLPDDFHEPRLMNIPLDTRSEEHTSELQSQSNLAC